MCTRIREWLCATEPRNVFTEFLNVARCVITINSSARVVPIDFMIKSQLKDYLNLMFV